MTNPLLTFDPPLSGPPVLGTTDVSFTTEDTAVGRLLVAATPGGTLLTCAYAADVAAEDRWLQRLADTVSPRVLRHAAPTDRARRAIAAYFAGASRSLDVRFDLALTSPFQRDVLTALRERVGYGERTTYSALADGIRSPGGLTGGGHRARGKPAVRRAALPPGAPGLGWRRRVRGWTGCQGPPPRARGGNPQRVKPWRASGCNSSCSS